MFIQLGKGTLIKGCESGCNIITALVNDSICILAAEPLVSLWRPLDSAPYWSETGRHEREVGIVSKFIMCVYQP